MSSSLYPDIYIKSTYLIDFEQRYREGYRGIIFDIDNTLVEHGAPADARSIELFVRLKGIGYQTLVLSNNNESRVKSFSDAVGSSYIYNGGKPLPRKYHQAMTIMGTGREDTFFVGDQILTDILGARLAGIDNYLVKQINKKEPLQVVLKRYLEKIVLFFYKRKCAKEGKVFFWDEDKQEKIG